MGYNTIGRFNTVVGIAAARDATNINGIVAIGDSAMRSQTNSGTLSDNTYSQNTAIGYYAMAGDETLVNTGIANTAVGANALQNLKDGNHNVAIGPESLEANTSGSNNTVVGSNAMEHNTTGADNTAVGMDALNQNTTGERNIAIGNNALAKNLEANYNISIGVLSQYSNTSGTRNISIGDAASYHNESGIDNVSIGNSALFLNKNNRNTAVGSFAQYENVTGGDNVAIGYQSLYSNSSGNSNTAIGKQAGYDLNTASNYNTFVGWLANTTSGTIINNATAIGSGAIVNASNTIQLGNTSVTNLYHFGTIGTASDKRLKENISQTKYGLNSLLRLNPVDYTLKASGNNQIGFIAQELMEIIPEAVSGKEGDLEKGEILSVSYSTLIPVLTKAIQQQQEQIEEQNTLIEALIKRIEALEKN